MEEQRGMPSTPTSIPRPLTPIHNGYNRMALCRILPVPARVLRNTQLLCHNFISILFEYYYDLHQVSDCWA